MNFIASMKAEQFHGGIFFFFDQKVNEKARVIISRAIACHMFNQNQKMLCWFKRQLVA